MYRGSNEKVRQFVTDQGTFAPIWLPHWPAWMWTISLMVLQVRPPSSEWLVGGGWATSRAAATTPVLLLLLLLLPVLLLGPQPLLPALHVTSTDGAPENVKLQCRCLNNFYQMFNN